MPLFQKEDPKIFQNVPDSEKLSAVYAYVLKKEREDASKRVWKWFWIAFFIVTTYFSYLATMKMLQGALGGNAPTGGSSFGMPSMSDLSKALPAGGGNVGGLSAEDQKIYDSVMRSGAK